MRHNRIASGEVVTLLEILQAHAEAYAEGAYSLALIATQLADQERLGNDVRNDELFMRRLRSHLLKLIANCDHLPMTEKAARNLLEIVSSPEMMRHWDQPELVLHSSLAEVQSRLRDELSLNLFFSLPTEKKKYFDNPREGWEEVLIRFPDAVSDVEEMSKCFALSRYAAAVFHSLLVVEAGVIALGIYVDVADPKRGWDATTKRLKFLVDGGHASLPSKFTGHFGFLEQMSTSIQAMKFAWRNKVNHVDGKLVVMKPEFAPDVAEEIIVASRSFMRRLATELPK